MATCDVCGNNYDRSFQVIAGDKSYTFDSLECAAHKLAPRCDHCNCAILGHGIDAHGKFFCCAHCARAQGVHGAADRVE